MKKKWLIIGVIIIVVIIALFVGSKFLNKADEEELTEQNIKITPQMVTSVERGDLKKTVSTSGYLQPADEKTLTFGLNGEIEEILVGEGKRVTEGEVLVRLEKSQQELNYLKAKNTYELIKTSGSESEINEQELNLQIAEKNLEDTTLKAPFSGLITNISVKPDDYINSGSEVAYIIDDSSYEIEVAVNEIDSLEVVTLPVTVKLDKADRQFKPGFSTLVEIIIGKAEGKLLVPISAILDRKGQQMVVKVVDNKPAFTPVKAGFSDGVYTAIEEGLAEGEEIVINVYEFAKAGSKDNSMQGIPGMGGFMRQHK
jgi:HlyD family secretion protein